MKIILNRLGYLPDMTVGTLVLEDGTKMYTIERPWKKNESRISCIPEGLYICTTRESGVVKRSTGGKYTRGWEVTGVVGRTFIMIHPANYASELEGCIAVGSSLGVIGSKYGVANSRNTFDTFMEKTNKYKTLELLITGSNIYP